MLTEDKLMPFQKVDIAVPAQEFRIEYAVTELNRMSVVREFILRLLNLTPLYATELAAYYDFSKKELNVAVQDLLRASFIRFTHDNQIELTNAGQGLFKASPDGKPWVPQIEERSDRVSFDLVSFNFVDKKNSLSEKSPSIKIEADLENQKDSVSVAEKNFQRRYFEFLESQKNEDNGSKKTDNEKVDIYKVSQARLLQDFYVQEEQIFSYSLDRNIVERSPVLNIKDPNAIREKITEKLSHSYASSNVAQLSKVAELFDDKVFLKYVEGDSFDLSGYIYDMHEYQNVRYTDKREPVFGSIFITENWDKINRKLQAIEKNAQKKKELNYRAQWISPTNYIWGKTGKLLEILSSIYEVNAKDSLKDRLQFKLLLSCTSNSEEFQWKTFLADAPRGYIHKYDGEFQGGDVELFYVSGEFAVVIYHLILPELSNMPIPIGFITDESKLVHELEMELGVFLDQFNSSFGKNYKGVLFQSRK